MTDARCSVCNRRLRWGEIREKHGGPARGTYCPVHQPHLVTQPIAIPIEEESQIAIEVALENLLPESQEVEEP